MRHLENFHNKFKTAKLHGITEGTVRSRGDQRELVEGFQNSSNYPPWPLRSDYGIILVLVFKIYRLFMEFVLQLGENYWSFSIQSLRY